jgi:hypothetical protein
VGKWIDRMKTSSGGRETYDMAFTKRKRYFIFCKKLEQMEEGREIGVRANVREGRTGEGFSWKRPSQHRRKNAKMKCDEARQ